LEDSVVDEKTGIISRDGQNIGIMVDGEAVVGFPTPSRKQEFFSKTMEEWNWPEYTIPTYIKSHVHEEQMDRKKRRLSTDSHIQITRIDPQQIK